MSAPKREFPDFESEALYQEEGAILEFTEQLVDAMQKQDMRRSELARILGKSKPYITQILQGSTNFSLRTAARLALAVGMQLTVRLEEKSSADAEYQPLKTFVKDCSMVAAEEAVVLRLHHVRWALKTPASFPPSTEIQIG
ncbi:helix-turn-helix domain-containing protein [Myxococcus sp. RHSTA-1-4]|uniref:helix-turn-helix domain-containing protein n=1 Tax=Myxococcus sp. RHSTA-1-4 TaxID=2874601 RepID=UPI001CBE33CA|nr:helix-turn-helix transcriptional regulator [Myxococcus sp. RHSTA-1-4]MBZ4423266.1 helix-turn-helix domain-containing protein [Myxococcus sp. RHSTA-1-4]